MKLGELFVELGFKADTLKLKEFVKSIGDLNMSSIMAALGLGGMYAIVHRLMESAEDSALRIESFGQETGLSARKMQQWSTAAEMMGMKGDDVAASLRTLQSHLTGLKMGMDSTLLTPFAILNRVGAGITGQEDPFTLLQKVGSVIKNLTPDMRRLVIEQMGLSDSLLLVLNDMDKFNQLSKTQIAITDEQTISILKNRAAWVRTGNEWKVVLADIGATIAPALEKMGLFASMMVRLVHDSPAIQAALIAIGVGISAVAVALTAISIAGWISGLSELAIAIGLIATALALVVANIERIKDLTSGKTAWDWMGKLGLHDKIFSTALGLAGGTSSKNVTNTYNFKVFSNDPEEAANKVSEALRRMHSDAEYQSPLENK
jgi:hypothetical protein